MIKITARNLRKVFGRLLVFDNINFELEDGSSLVIAGRNGSGKSTLVKIIAGILGPTSGEVIYELDGASIDRVDWFRYVGFVAPYLQLYDEFTGYENLQIVAKLRGLGGWDKRIFELLEMVNLYHRKDDLVRGYSSGMKQRLKYAFALIHEPKVLILDEPTANLDQEGVELVWRISEEQKNRGILIVATNEAREMEMCEMVLNLDQLKSRRREYAKG
jgi:heme exporter protein A